MTTRILVIENDADFSETRSEYLKREGYEVVQASSLSAAEMYLENKNIHLAIIDIRMKDDNDEKDISGLIFAQKNAYRAIPKIILTGFTSLTYVREVMRPSSVGLPAAVDFVAKQDGPGVLVTAIKRVFDEIVHINWKLRIEWAFHINQFSMVSIINPNLDEEKLINHAEELEDLFRRLFFEKDLIRIEQVLWQHKGRIALTVLAFREGTKFESYIVVCGNSNTVNEEIRRYNEFSPRSHGESSTTLVLSKETTHYAACVYSLTTNQLEVIKNLRDLYNSGPEKIFNLSITNLFQNTLRIWHQDKLINLNTHTAYDLYTEKLYLSKDWLTAESFNNRLRGVEQKALALGITLEQSMMGLKIHYKEQSFSLANPSTAIVEAIGDVKSTIAIITSGTLSGKNILVDEFGRTWLTDFHEAGRAPQLWNFVALEASVRFDWLDTKEILRLHEMENSLNETGFSNLETRDLEPTIRKTVRAIQVIRKQAVRTVGKNFIAYHQGVLFHALQRFFHYDLNPPLTPTELARYLHILISLTSISMLVNQSHHEGKKALLNESSVLTLDITTKTVFLGEKKIRLAPRPFKLLQYLYENSERICTMDELRRSAIGENYNATYIHTLVGRIRDAIENDSKKAQYLILEPNVGYRLIVDPNKVK